MATTEIDLLSVDVQGRGSWEEWENGTEVDSGAVARLCDALPVPLSLYGAACPPSDLLGAEGCQGIVKVDIEATTEVKVARACAVLCPA